MGDAERVCLFKSQGSLGKGDLATAEATGGLISISGFQPIANCCLISQSQEALTTLFPGDGTQALKAGPPHMDLCDNPAQGGRGRKCESSALR